MKKMTILLALMVFAACNHVFGGTNTVSPLGSDPATVELILMPYGKDTPENLTVEVMIRNVSRGILKADDVWAILRPYELTWESPNGTFRIVRCGGWYGAKPRDAKPGETWSASAKPTVGNPKMLPADGNGIYFLRWRIGANRSNTLCYLFKDGQWERLPTVYLERGWIQQKERQKALQNQASQAIGAGAPQPKR